MKVVSKLQKERLTKDVRYQEFNELTLDQKACEGSTGQGLVLCQDALTGNACPVRCCSLLPCARSVSFLLCKFQFVELLGGAAHPKPSPEGRVSAKLTGEEWRYVWQGKSLEKMLKSRISARIPHPALRATFPPGEGITHRNNRATNRNLNAKRVLSHAF